MDMPLMLLAISYKINNQFCHKLITFLELHCPQNIGDELIAYGDPGVTSGKLVILEKFWLRREPKKKFCSSSERKIFLRKLLMRYY